MKIIEFIAAGGREYELHVEGDGYVPKIIVEDQISERILDLTSDRSWDSLADMTHDLKLEIISWGSDVGD